MFSWLASWSSEASGVALIEICSNNNAAACPAHVNTVTTLLCQLPGAVGEPQSKYPCWPPFLPADVCCVQVPVWPCPPLVCQHIAEQWAQAGLGSLACCCWTVCADFNLSRMARCLYRLAWGAGVFRRCSGLLRLIWADFLPTLHPLA